jgi:small subunit ribosomal protein S29
MAAANSEIFNSTPVTTQPALPMPLPAKATLKQLADLGISSPEASWPVFVALWAELTQPGRPPIMLALDGLSHIMRESEYLSADVKPIHSHDLTIVRHFVDHLSGKVSLPNGGIVLAATSKSNARFSPALDFSIQLAEARARNADPSHLPMWNPYKVVDQRALQCLANIELLNVSGLSKEEARTIMEYYARSGLLRAKVDEKFVAEKWSLAGMGNVGELERTSIRLI